jgi:hypothetical protein
MSERTYYRHKKELQDSKLERMQQIALYFQDQHLERIDKCEIIEKLMWENYIKEKDPTKKVGILKSILELQPYLSAYYDATRYVLAQNIKFDFSKQPDTYLSINSDKWNHDELRRQKQQGKMFDPYKKDA